MGKIRTLDDIIGGGKNEFGNFWKFAPLIILVIVAIVCIKGMVYSIGPDEVGVIQRFGKYIRLSPPGLHAKIPFGIEKVTPIKVEKIFKEEFGIRTTRAGVR